MESLLMSTLVSPAALPHFSDRRFLHIAVAESFTHAVPKRVLSRECVAQSVWEWTGSHG